MRWLAFAAAATTCLLVLRFLYESGDINTNVDTGDTTAIGVLIIVFLIAVAAWIGLVVHALRHAASHLRRHVTSRRP